MIVPAGILCLLPFELLVDSADAETGTAHFLIESRGIRYAPSLTALHVLRRWETTRERPERALWAAGDPVYGRDDPRLGETGKDERGNPSATAAAAAPSEAAAGGFQRLIFSAAELEEIRAVCKAPAQDVVTGLNATKAAVVSRSEKGLLGRYRFVHFATHGSLGLDVGQQPGLVLSLVGDRGSPQDGYVQLDEVMHLRLNADLVVLSACETGRGRLYEGEGVRGLARAFLHAGSRGVVCSLWRVSDQKTSYLMAAFYRGLVAGRPAALALREAKRALIREGQPPVFWAPFVLNGR